MAEEKDIKTEETAETEETFEETADTSEGPVEETAEENADASEDVSEKDEKETEPVADEKDIKIAELEDRFKRLFAEFDNFRKRSEAEKSARYADGERAVLLKVLPLMDNFERALATVPEESREDSFVKGMELVYKAFTDAMTAMGVKAIESVGQPFNADYHNAVMHVDDDNEPENTVVEEFQKGYMFGDKVLRYSMVKVAN